MEHSWRLRPPIQGNALCPTCSFPHFPFCPSQPLDGSHRPFPPYNTTIPPYDIPQNALGPPQIPESWLRNRSQMLPSFPPPPHLGNPIGGGFSCDDERIHKRTRIENVGIFPQFSPVLRNDEIGSSFEDERRLNLIRDHGGRFVPASLLRPDFHYVHEEQRRIGNLDQLGFGSRKGTDSDYIFPSAQNPYEEDELYRREYSSGSRMQFNSNGFISDQSYGFRIRDGIGKGPNYTLKIEQQQDTHYNQHEAPLHLRQSFAGPGPVQQHISDSAFDHITQGFDGKYQIYDNDRIQATPVEEPQFKVKNRSSSSLVIQNEEFRKPVEQSAHWNMSNQGAYMLASSRGSMGSAAVAQELGSMSFDVRSPLPPLPPQHFPGDPSRPSVPFLQAATSSPMIVSSVNVSSSVPRATQGFPVQPLTKTPSNSKPQHPVLGGFSTEELQISQQTSSSKYPEVGQTYPLKYPALDKPKFVDAAHLFKQPHRATRPDHIVVILRGLPGSGKSYLAKLLRDLEVENGGNAPRIHSMDDYFMTEVEKAEETEGSKSSSTLVRGKRKITKVMEYCYEPEMEEDYRSSMLKAFKKTLEEGIFTFIIVDDRNLRVADFSQFWATAKRSGYEVYLLEAAYKDPLGCAARNVHGFTSDDIQNMANLWEQAPSLYLQLEVKSLFRGDLNGDAIQEVDMDMEDASGEEESKSELQDGLVKAIKPPSKVDVSDVLSKPGKGWETEGDEPSHEVKELGRSKWSEDVDEDIERKEGSKGHLDSLSGLIQVYSKGAKSVHWGDQSGKRGFSIGAAKKSKISLIIGPGAGYNLNFNPLPEEEKGDAIEGNNKSEPKRRTAFLEQLRAERESFKVVFDRRRQRIGLEMEDD